MDRNDANGLPDGVSSIGYWSEIKLDIIREYATAYSQIMTAQRHPQFKHAYIDAFAGAGYHISRSDGTLVWGSPLNALLVDPPFHEYHLIDLDRGSVECLESQVRSRTSGPYDPNTVYIYNGDCNHLLISTVFPLVKYEDYRRGLCLLDPYGLHFQWEVVAAAGRMRSIELFLNFPIADMNRNVLLRDSSKVLPSQAARMDAFWGDQSWRREAYTTKGNLFGFEEKTTNEVVAKAYKKRLRTVAGFAYVPEPIPMRNSKGAIVYYLFFAAQKPVAARIVAHIFDKYRDRAG